MLLCVVLFRPAGIEDRIARWSLLPVGNQESLQVLKYGAGQQYRPHWDFFQVG
jgi:prolyl 4-hydroxylase